METLKKWLMPILLLFLVILDGVLSNSITPILSTGSIIVPIQLYLVLQYLVAFYNSNNKNWLYVVLGMGLLSDLFYFGILGINTVLFPLTFYIVQVNAKNFPDIKLARGAIVVISILIYQVLSWILVILFKFQTNLVMTDLIFVIFKSIILNGVMFLIFDKWFTSWLIKYPFIKPLG